MRTIRTGRCGATVLLAMLVLASPAHAILPEGVRAMIVEAARSGDKATLDAITRVAKATNPGNEHEIDAIADVRYAAAVADAQEQRESKLAAQHFLDGWTGEGQAGFSLTSGNSDQTGVLLGITVKKDGLQVQQAFTAAVDYLRSAGVTARERYSAAYSSKFLLREGLYLYGTLGWERDEFSGISRRFTESTGAGYRAIDRRNMSLQLDAGPALRQTLYTTPPNGTDIRFPPGPRNELGGRASLAYRWTLGPGTSFAQDGSLVSTQGDTTLISTSALTSKLSGALSARLSFNLQHETSPIDGLKPTDTATRASIVYDF